MASLAGPEMRGRGCGTTDEHAAARYIAESFRQSQIPGGFRPDLHLQPVQLVTPTASAPATLRFSTGRRQVVLTQGRDFVVRGPPDVLDGRFLRISSSEGPTGPVTGRVVIFEPAAPDPAGVQRLLQGGAAAVMLSATPQVIETWQALAKQPPGRTQIIGVPAEKRPGVVFFLTPQAMASLRPLIGGTIHFDSPRGPPILRQTYNVMGVLHGTAVDADRRAVLLTAHYDHLGVREGVIYPGANDDASGTAAVLEFARLLGAAPRHGRTVYFALFGCEEEGGLGAQHFLAHLPMELSDLSVNLEFEMIGADDPQRPGYLMLTGWDRSNLGPTLQAHGARIGPDLYPEQNFFQRSDNYQLALKGVVAQTVSAWPMTPTYHSPTDTLANLDLDFMTQVIGSMLEPITWLLDSDFRPAWNRGQKPGVSP